MIFKHHLDIYIKIDEMKDNKAVADRFLKWFGKNMNQLKNKMYKMCSEKDLNWDEDTFSDTYLKVYDIICKKGLKDTTDRGFECYFFKSLTNNLKLEPVYARNKKRDYNINSDNINDVYETYYNKTNNPAINKIVKDLYVDFATLYIMSKVEEHFDSEHFYLFRIKTLGNLTFKELATQSKIKASRLKVIEVQRWLKENVTKEEIKKVFFELYGDLLPN